MLGEGGGIVASIIPAFIPLSTPMETLQEGPVIRDSTD